MHTRYERFPKQRVWQGSACFHVSWPLWTCNHGGCQAWPDQIGPLQCAPRRCPPRFRFPRAWSKLNGPRQVTAHMVSKLVANIVFPNVVGQNCPRVYPTHRAPPRAPPIGVVPPGVCPPRSCFPRPCPPRDSHPRASTPWLDPTIGARNPGITTDAAHIGASQE